MSIVSPNGLSRSWAREFKIRHNIPMYFAKEVTKSKYICKLIIQSWFEHVEKTYSISKANPHLMFNCGMNLMISGE